MQVQRGQSQEEIIQALRRQIDELTAANLQLREQLARKEPVELATWLDTPRGAEGLTPAELLEMDEIDRARYLAVSIPSPGLVRPPAWVRRPIPEAFRAGAEHRQEALPPPQDDELAALIADEDEDVEDISTI
jgi:hypothetical protein